jgi:hypothetical protein
MIKVIGEKGLLVAILLQDTHDIHLISLMSGRRFEIRSILFLKVIMKNLISPLLVTKKMVERLINSFSIPHKIIKYTSFLETDLTNAHFV